MFGLNVPLPNVDISACVHAIARSANGGGAKVSPDGGAGARGGGGKRWGGKRERWTVEKFQMF